MDVHDPKQEDVKVAESKQENRENVNSNQTNGDPNSSSSSSSSSRVLRPQQQDDDGETLSMSFPPRHLQHRYQTAETTQLISTRRPNPSKHFHTGTQFLSSSYLGETPVLLPVWSNVTAVDLDKPTSSSAGIKEEMLHEGRERYQEDRHQENKMESSIPTAQHLPPGANTRIAEKKKKTVSHRSEGNISSSILSHPHFLPHHTHIMYPLYLFMYRGFVYDVPSLVLCTTVS